MNILVKRDIANSDAELLLSSIPIKTDDGKILAGIHTGNFGDLGNPKKQPPVSNGIHADTT